MSDDIKRRIILGIPYIEGQLEALKQSRPEYMGEAEHRASMAVLKNVLKALYNVKEWEDYAEKISLMAPHLDKLAACVRLKNMIRDAAKEEE